MSKTFIVTGGNSGLGFQCASALIADVLPAMTLFQSNVNTPAKSGKRLAQLASGSEGNATGKYFSNGAETQSSALSQDKVRALDLWNRSADMTHLPRDIESDKSGSRRPLL